MTDAPDDDAQGVGSQRMPSDPRSTEELISIALIGFTAGGNPDCDPWSHELEAGHAATRVLQARGNRDVLDAAARLCDSVLPLERELGAHILGQLGDDRPYREECCDTLMPMLTDKDECVRLEAFYALGHLHNRRSDKVVASHAGDPDPNIRRATAFALCGTTDPDGIRALLDLMRDAQAETRDWATTGIGQETTIDGPDIRAALLERTSDEDAITRAEALRGLARRQDARALPLLLAELQRQLDQPTDREEAHLDYLIHEAVFTLLNWPEDKRPQSDAATLIACLRVMGPSTV